MAAAISSAGLAGIGCCGLFFVLWMAQGLFTVGGVGALLFVTRYEAIVALVVGAVSWFAWRLARDRFTRWANALVGLTALFVALSRFAWDLNQEAVMAVPPVYWPFAYRQAILGFVAIVSGALLLASLANALLSPRCGSRRGWATQITSRLSRRHADRPGVINEQRERRAAPL